MQCKKFCFKMPISIDNVCLLLFHRNVTLQYSAVSMSYIACDTQVPTAFSKPVELSLNLYPLKEKAISCLFV